MCVLSDNHSCDGHEHTTTIPALLLSVRSMVEVIQKCDCCPVHEGSIHVCCCYCSLITSSFQPRTPRQQLNIHMTTALKVTYRCICVWDCNSTLHGKVFIAPVEMYKLYQHKNNSDILTFVTIRMWGMSTLFNVKVIGGSFSVLFLPNSTSSVPLLSTGI